MPYRGKFKLKHGVKFSIIIGSFHTEVVQVLWGVIKHEDQTNKRKTEKKEQKRLKVRRPQALKVAERQRK